jgi:MioC protein
MNIEIIVGSMLGASEYLADEIEETLKDEYNITQHLNPQLSELQWDGSNVWLICTSTHGAGDYPDNIQAFVKQLHQTKPDLSQLTYGIVGLGSRSYDTFCFAAKNMDALLTSLGAKRIGSRLEIDVLEYPLPEDALPEWLKIWSQTLKK